MGPLLKWWLLNQIHCVRFHFSCVHFWKKEFNFLQRGTALCSCKAIFSFEWPKRRRYNTVQARSGKDTASDWTKTICLTATNSCYKSSFENNLVPRFSRLLQKNFKHQPVGDILFFFPEPLLAQSSKHLTFFRQGMYWDGIKMERPIIMKCCTIIC